MMAISPDQRVVDDTRKAQKSDVLVWDARIAPALTEKVLADARERGVARIISNVRAEGVEFDEEPGRLLAAYAAARGPKQPERRSRWLTRSYR